MVKEDTLSLSMPRYQPAEPVALHEKRVSAQQTLDELPIPSDKKYTNWIRYNLLERVSEKPLGGKVPLIKSSNQKVTARTFGQTTDYEEFLCEILADFRHYFAALSASYYRDGVFIRVPAGEQALVTASFGLEVGKLNAYRTVIVVEDGAELIYVEELADNCKKETVFASGVEVIVGENARVDFYGLQTWSEQVLNLAAYKGRAARDGRLNWLLGMFGSGFSQVHAETELAGEGSETNVHSVFYGDAAQHLDQTLLAYHKHGHGSSDTYTRGILDGSARAVYKGMIRIDPGAHGSAADQNGHAMLLKDTAHADMIPGLEIDANDVTAGHGATVGQVDDEQLFYLMARGINEPAARQMIIRGFFETILREIKDEKVRDRFWATITAKQQAAVVQ